MAQRTGYRPEIEAFRAAYFLDPVTPRTISNVVEMSRLVGAG